MIDVTEMVSYANLFVFSTVRLKFGTEKLLISLLMYPGSLC